MLKSWGKQPTMIIHLCIAAQTQSHQGEGNMPQYNIWCRSHEVNNQQWSSIYVPLPKHNLIKERGICPSMDIIQQQLGTSKKGGNMSQCGYLMHNQKDESNIINELSPNSKIHQTSICQARERPNASKSIFHKRKHSNNYSSTNLQKPVRVKTVKDDV